MKKLLREEAEGYWWFRLVKVMYIGFLVVLAGVAWLMFEPPVHLAQYDTYEAKCDSSGYVFGAYDLNDMQSNRNSSAFELKDYDKDVVAKFICENGADADRGPLIKMINATSGEDRGNYIKLLGQPQNYSLIVSKKYYSPTYSDLYIQVFGYLVAALFFLFGIPKLFGYIVFGKKGG